MLNSAEKHKIKNFVADKVLASSVKRVLMDAFLKNSGTDDVQKLAAERIAINLLENGFKELEKNANEAQKVEKDIKNVGL